MEMNKHDDDVDEEDSIIFKIKKIRVITNS
jgi:hypothetical protein